MDTSSPGSPEMFLRQDLEFSIYGSVFGVDGAGFMV